MILATWHNLILCGERLTVTAYSEGECKLNMGCKRFDISVSLHNLPTAMQQNIDVTDWGCTVNVKTRKLFSISHLSTTL
jgi:hypothetical protein